MTSARVYIKRPRSLACFRTESMMEQDHQLPEATINTAMDDDIWDTQFLEAISAAMDAMEEEENMWNAPLEELPRCAYTKERKKTRYSIF